MIGNVKTAFNHLSLVSRITRFKINIKKKDKICFADGTSLVKVYVEYDAAVPHVVNKND